MHVDQWLFSFFLFFPSPETEMEKMAKKKTLFLEVVSYLKWWKKRVKNSNNRCVSLYHGN
jgi:hypothetical protein